MTTGFPSPADDHIEQRLDLNKFIVKHPAATFFVRAHGDSKETGIQTGDILVVDRSLDPTEKSIVMAVINGEFAIKQFSHVHKNNEIIVWGVVTHVIHAFAV